MKIRVLVGLLVPLGLSTAPAGAQDLFVSDFTGIEPAANTPWTATSYQDPGLRFDGWVLGAGASPELGQNDVFVVNVNAGPTASTLSEALQDDEYLGFTIQGLNGAIDLGGLEARFTIRRQEWFAPLEVALFSSVDGFQLGQELLRSVPTTQGYYLDQDLSFTFPAQGYDNLSGPIEFRLYLVGATYANHPLELSAFEIVDPNPNVSGDVLEADLAGNQPAMNAPWTATSFLANGLVYSGIDMGFGVTPEPLIDNAFAFNLNAGAAPTDLASAVANGQYLSFSLDPGAGLLDLGGREIAFRMKRREWNSPRAFTLMTSIDGFQVGQELFTSASTSQGDYSEHEYRFIFPLTGYDSLSGPVECRIYAHDAQFANKTVELTALSILDVGPVADVHLSSSPGGRAWTEPFGQVFRLGAPLTLAAEPEVGYRFRGWSGDLSGHANPRTVNVTGPMTVVAEFEPLAFPQMRLGTNLESAVDWTKQWIWVDQMHFAREWMTRVVGSTAWESGMEAEIPLDAQGWPTQVPFLASDGQMHYVHTILPALTSGTHEVIVEGTGEIAFLGAVTTPNYILNGGTTTIPITIPAGNTESLFLRIYSSSAADPVRKLRVIMPGFSASYQNDPFHPDFLARLEPFKVLRFMDLLETNHSPVTSWSQQRPQDWYTQAGKTGISYKWVAALANRLLVDPWICIPHAADDNYVREVARLLRDEVDPSLEIHVEYSNETWNGLFSQTTYVQDQGVALSLDSDRWNAGQKFVAMRSAQIWEIFEQEFVDDSRLIKVLATQSPNPVISTQRLEALSDPALNPNAVMPDALAIAPYFGRTFTPADIPPAAAAYPTVDDMLDVMAPQDIATLQLEVRAQRQLADRHGLRLICYEGGQHFVGMNGAENDAQLVSLIEQANRDPRMYDLYRDYLDTLATERVEDFNQFIYTGGWSKWGSWGALESQDQPLAAAPKYRALTDWRQIRLSANLNTISTTLGNTVDFNLDAGAIHAGRGYQLYGGTSGRFPGSVLPNGQLLPLNTDSFTSTVRSGTNGPTFQAFAGSLDALGRATPRLQVGPLSANLIGRTLVFAAALQNPWGFPSNAVQVELVP